MESGELVKAKKNDEDELSNKDEVPNSEDNEKFKKKKENIVQKLYNYVNREFVEDGKSRIKET
jgi:hypothetical protein